MKKTTQRMVAALVLTAATVSYAKATTYNQAILADGPVMFLGMDTPGSGTQADLTGHGHNGTYQGGAPGSATLPNGDKAADFNGTNQFLTVPSNAALSVPTARALTIESWIKPDVLNFPSTEAEQYVYFLGKGNPSQGYEYANRMYSYVNSAGRPNRISTYDWNTSGGLGSGAYFQDTVTTTQWIHVADVINMNTGYIDIYKNGVLRGHVPLSQYSVTPGVTQAPFNVGTRNGNSWFKGAIGKVAVYGKALTASQIAAHYAAMSAAGSGSGSTGGTTPPPTAAVAPKVSGVSAANLTQTGATVNWTTDLSSLSQVEYGATTSYGSTTAQSTTPGTSHSVGLTGLTAGTVYHYRVKSLDPKSNLTGVSADNTFTTAAAPVAQAPVITSVVAAPTSTGVTITWTTDKVSHSQVNYGVTSSYGTLSYQSAAAGTAHSLALSGLKSGTVYHFQAMSLDDTTKLTGKSADLMFTTTGTAAGADTISNVTAAATSSGANISWSTTLVSHSQVEYGLTSAYGALSYQSVATGTSHNLALGGLKAGQVYHYRVKSLDASGNTAVSGDFTFHT